MKRKKIEKNSIFFFFFTKKRLYLFKMSFNFDFFCLFLNQKLIFDLFVTF